MEIFPYEFRPGQRELVSFIRSAVGDAMCPVVEAGTGTGKTVSALAGVLPLAREKGLKVVYLTRTKSQQAQVVRECGAMGAFCACLQGRSASTCPKMRGDPDLRSGTSDEIAKLCSEYKRRREDGFACEYFAKLEGLDEEEWLGVLREHPDPADFAGICEAEGVCPYELMKHLVPHAEVVAASYPFVFMPQVLSMFEDWTGTSLSRMIVVVDEAHNLPDYLRELQTYEYGRRAMELAEKEAAKEGDHELVDGLKVTDVSSVLKEVLASAEREYLIDEDGIVPPMYVEEELMSRLGTTSVVLTRIAKSLQDIGDIIEEKRKQMLKLPRSYIGIMGRFLEMWMSDDDVWGVRLVVGGDSPRFQAYCMDPAPAAEPLNGCYASLLMSGTLEPLEDFCRELGLERAVPKRVSSPFPPGNLLTLYSPDVSMRYEERRLESNYNEITRLVIDTVGAVDVNTALFFPSYDFMDRMIADGLPGRMGREVYYEHRGMPQAELMETFESFRLSRGSVLFAVTGGRISEGLDFPGDALELAVIIGIPFPKPTAKLRAMERYYDHRLGDGRRHVVVIPAQRKMRQSIGRLIRSETDRGVAVILDRRAATMDPSALPSSDIPSAVAAFLSGRRRAGQPLQGLRQVHVDQDRPAVDLLGAVRLAHVDARVGGAGVLPGHLPERVLDDPGGVAAHSELQEQHLPSDVLQEPPVPLLGRVPSLVLDEPAVDAEIGRGRRPAVGASRYQFGRDPHVPLLRDHPPDLGLVVPCDLPAGHGALEEPVVALGVVEPLLVEARLLELVIHVGGDDEVVLPAEDAEQVPVRLPDGGVVALHHDRPGPPGPELLPGAIGVEPSGVQVAYVVLRYEVGEALPELLPGVVEPCGGR